MKKLPPDDRPKWYDDLKVTFCGVEYTAEEYRKLCEREMSFGFGFVTPHWSKDPTYFKICKKVER